MLAAEVGELLAANGRVLQFQVILYNGVLSLQAAVTLLCIISLIIHSCTVILPIHALYLHTETLPRLFATSKHADELTTNQVIGV